MKRVYCLYRVSTKGQVDHDDIPMQRTACRAFAEKNGWTICKEFLEKGNKAGWKKIEKMLSAFRLTDFPETPAAVTVNRANEILNSL